MSAILGNSPSPPNHLFAYGTLMRGQSHRHLLEEAGVVSVAPASISGQLLDLGDHPALRLSSYGNSRVHGELIEFEALDTILTKLDEYEGAGFRREIVNVTLDDGGSQFAWTYVTASTTGTYPVIPSGDWRSKTAGA